MGKLEFWVYFTGHGVKGTGDWITEVEGENVSCAEVLETIS